MDFYIHPITSGGLEMPLVESLLAGTPIATVNYSCGEEFCEQDFVTEIAYSTYRELGSQFIKSQPYAHHITKIMEDKIGADLSADSIKGREWALKEFDLNIICKRIEDWIDSCPEVVHDFAIDKMEQNDRYSFQNIEDPEEWAIDLIKNVFGYDESSKNDTVKRIVDKINKGQSRVELYNKAIAAARRHNESKRRNASSNFFKVEEETDNVCVMAPGALEDKLNISKFFSDLCKKEKNVFLVGDEMDRNVFSQFGKFVLLPRNEDRNQIEWIRNLKTLGGKKRFKAVYVKYQNELKYVENKQE